MSYISWFNDHAAKHKQIVAKLMACGMEKEQIIDYFVFENMVAKERDFCPLYAENKKCHDVKYLNCYICACPNFRFKDEGIEEIDGKTKYSFCDIACKDGKLGIYGDAIHQDCSACSVPHAKSYVEKHFDLEWKKMLEKSVL